MEYKEIREAVSCIHSLMACVLASELEEWKGNEKKKYDFCVRTYIRMPEKQVTFTKELAILAATNSEEQFLRMLKDLFGVNAPFTDAFIYDFYTTYEMLQVDTTGFVPPSGGAKVDVRPLSVKRAQDLFGEEYGERMSDIIQATYMVFAFFLYEINMICSALTTNVQVEMEKFYNSWLEEEEEPVSAVIMFGKSPTSGYDTEVGKRSQEDNFFIMCALYHNNPFITPKYTWQNARHTGNFLASIFGGEGESYRQILYKITKLRNREPEKFQTKLNEAIMWLEELKANKGKPQ